MTTKHTFSENDVIRNKNDAEEKYLIIGKDKKSYYLRSVDSVPSDGNFESKI